MPAHNLSNVPAMSEEEFVVWQALLEKRTGIYISSQRLPFLQTHVGMRMLESGFNDYQAYYHYVLDGPKGYIEWNILLDKLTVQETRFFRDKQALDLVGQFMADKALGLPTTETFEAWSVGCSTGEEVYTLAMLAQHHFAPRAKRFAITGTDISSQALQKARQGQYSMRTLEQIPEYLFATSIDKSADARSFTISPQLQKKTCFTKLNLLKLAQYPLYSQHLIFCQNVLLYFRRWRRNQILSLLAERLAPDGLLVIGLGEANDFEHPELTRIADHRFCAFKKSSSNNQERVSL